MESLAVRMLWEGAEEAVMSFDFIYFSVADAGDLEWAKLCLRSMRWVCSCRPAPRLGKGLDGSWGGWEAAEAFPAEKTSSG